MTDVIKEKKKKNPLLSIFLTILFDLLGFGLIIPVLAPLVLYNEVGIIPASFTMEDKKIVFGLLMAIYSLAQFFSNSILGAISDRIGRRKTLLFSLVFTLLGYVLLTGGIHAKSLVLVFLGRLLPGIAAGNIGICYSAIADVSTPETKTRNFALIGVAFGLGFVIGPFVGGILSDKSIVSWFYYDTPFFATVFLSLINLIVTYFNFEETLKVKTNKKLTIFTGLKNINKAFLHPSLRSLYIVVFLYNLGFSFFTSFLTVFLIDKFQFNQQQIGMTFGFLGICIIVGQGYIVRKLSKKWSPEKMTISFLPVLAIAIFALLFPSNYHAIYFILPFISIAYSAANSSATALISNYAGPSIQGEIMGITMSLNALSQGIPGLIGGSLSALNMYYPSVLAGILALVGWLILHLFLRKTHDKVEAIS